MTERMYFKTEKEKLERRIKALEMAVDYVPSVDRNHSDCVLQDMLDELRDELEKIRG